jgi:hypothetical protein
MDLNINSDNLRNPNCSQTLKKASMRSLVDEYIRHSVSNKPVTVQPTVNEADSSSGSESDESENHQSDDKNRNERKSLRQSLASAVGVDVSNRLVNKFGSVKAVINENERMERAGLFVIHPYSNFRFAWDMLTLVMLLLNIILIPIFMAFPIFEFSVNRPVNQQSHAYVAMVIRLISDAWFSVDVALNFRTGIVVEGSNSEVIVDAREIRRKYLRGWFLLDIISTFPFDVAVSTFTDIFYDANYEKDFRQSTMIFRYLRLTKLFQLLRLLRVSRIWRYMHQWDEMFNLPYDSALVLLRMLGAFLCLLLYAHLSACIQFMVPMVMEFPKGCWIRQRGLHTIDTDLDLQYGWSFFRAVSQMLCIGYGQFPPQTMTDMITTMTLMMFGAICFAVFIGYATSIVQSHNASKRLYAEKYSAVKHYMIFRKIPTDLRKRISDYYENRFQASLVRSIGLKTYNSGQDVQ